jgi:hypothetical protein
MSVREAGRRSRRSPLLASCPAGLARVLRAELSGLPGVEVTGAGSDGQADYVLFEADRDGRAGAVRCRLAEGVFAEAGRASRGGVADAAVLAGRCWRPEAVQRALSLWAEQVRPLSAGMTFQVTTRARTGPQSLRAGLRDAMVAVISRDRPRWKPSGQGELEVWLAEWRDGEFVVGLRVGGNRRVVLARSGQAGSGQAGSVQAGSVQAGSGQAGSRSAEPDPALAAAMVSLAGMAAGVLLDPCCGHGSVLGEAVVAGWTAVGTDPDAESVTAASRAVPAADVRQGDACEILEPDDSIDACVTRLPAGEHGGVPAAALAELSRVTRTGGAVVVLAADIQRAAIPGPLRLRRQLPVRRPDGPESIWVFRRA